MARAGGNILGAWAFLIGVILAILAAFVPAINLTSELWAGIFVAIGIVIGLLNISEAEIKEFLLAGTVLVIVSALSGASYQVLPYVGNIMKALVILFTPATIVVALKVVFSAARR
jgi:hypothetical protein